MRTRTLKVPREEARTLLAQQIAKFVELEERVVETKDDLERYKRDRLRHTKVSIIVNERLFGEDVDRFFRYELASPSYNAGFEEQLEFYKKEDGNQLTELHAMHDGIDLMNEGVTPPKQPRKASERKPWTRTERIEAGSLVVAIIALLVALAVSSDFRNAVYKVASKVWSRAPATSAQ